MINYFFIVIIFTFSVQMFSFTNTLGKVKRTFEGFDYSFAQQGVMAIKESENQSYGPYFYPSLFNKVMNDYFAKNLESKANNVAYEVNAKYSNPYSNEGEASQYYQRVSVTFACTFDSIYQYSDSKSFVIKERS